MFRIPSLDIREDIWFFGLRHFEDSCVLAQKFKAHPVPSYCNEQWFEPVLDEKPALKAIISLDDVVGCSFSVLSP
eukprot:15449574-Alexandrium_andersonii.AAC.1